MITVHTDSVFRHAFGRVAATAFVVISALSTFASAARAQTPLGWSTPWRLAGPSEGSPGLGAITGSELGVVIRASDGFLYEKRFEPRLGGWAPSWESIGIAAASGPDVSYPRYDDGLSGDSTADVVFRAADGSIHRAWRDWDGGWHDEAIGGKMIGEPETIFDGVVTHVFARGADKHLYHNEFDGYDWSGFTDLGGSWTGDPAVSASWWGPDRIRRLDLALRGEDGAVWHRYYTPNTGFSTPQRLVNGVIAGSPTITSWSERIDIFARNVEGQLLQLQFRDGSWSSAFQGLGGYLTSDPSAVSPAPHRIEVAYTGSDGDTYVLRYREPFGPSAAKVMQYNIYGWVGNADSSSEVAELASHVRQEIVARDAHLISLNEVCVSEYYQLFDGLPSPPRFAGLPMLVWFERLDSKPACGGAFGNAIVYDSDAVGYAEPGPVVELNEQPEPRYLVCAEFPVRDLVFCTTHLRAGDDADAEAERIESVGKINDALEGYLAASWRVVLAGDLNSKPDDNVLDPVYNGSYGDGAVGRFFESEASRTEDVDATTDGSPLTPPVDPWDEKLDYIFVDDRGGRPTAPEVEETELSDHHIVTSNVPLEQ